MSDKTYFNELQIKYMEKGGGLPPIVAGVPDELQETVQMVAMEQYLEGYKAAKMKFKSKYSV